MHFTGMTALVTGASSGLGEEFAQQLASQGCNLVLVARTESKLTRLAESLRQKNGVTVTVIPADLSSADGAQRVVDEVHRRALPIDLLVNNAGLGLFENFMETPLQQQIEQLDLNVRSLMVLTHGLAPHMVSTHRGGVINLASTAAFQPLPGAAVYAASKSFVLLFSEALSVEFEKHGVHVLAVCPGPVATRFFANMNSQLAAKDMDQPAPIVAEILRAFVSRKRVVIPAKSRIVSPLWPPASCRAICSSGSLPAPSTSLTTRQLKETHARLHMPSVARAMNPPLD